MKKLLFSAFLMGAGFSANAQLPNGSTAPDFTAQDINGNSHTLSTYLNAGKTVIMDISATWCGPCWNYHNTHALADFYNSYGPNGSDEIMVLFIEGDNATSVDALYGIGSGTQGNWVEGTPYPIINSAAVASLYQITYYPTVYRICPNGLVSEIGSLSATQLRTSVNTNCGALNGVQNHAEIRGSQIAMCSTTGVATAIIENYGTNNITSATAVLKENGTQIATAPYSGNLSQFATGAINFPASNFSMSSDYTVELTNINGNLPYNDDLTTAEMDVVAAGLTGTSVTVKVFTDNYPSETTWQIRNSATNEIVASGGPYVGAGGTAAGGPDALKTKTHDVILPAGVNCYKIVMNDSYGDGFGYGTNPAGQYGMEVVSNGIVILNLNLGNFGSTFTRDAAFRTDGTSSIDEMKNSAVSIYPNPANSILFIQHPEIEVESVIIYNIDGKIVKNVKVNEAQLTEINISDFNSGMYFIQLFNKDNQKVHTERISKY